MSRWVKLAIALVLLFLVACGGLILYIAPSQQLDLAYQPVPLVDRVLNMVRRQSLELVLSSEDVENLAKRAIAQKQGNVREDVTVTGIHFELEDQQMKADVNIRYLDFIPAEVQVAYQFDWQSPNLVGTIAEAKIKSITFPKRLFQPILIPLGEQLPKLIHIEDVRLEQGELHIRFQKPKLSDLQELL